MENKTIKHADMEIDFSKIFKIVSADKKNVFIYCAIAALIGLIVAFSIPNVYKTSVMLAPETSGSSLTSSNLSSIASMIGMDVKSMSSDDALYPEIYPDLMNSMDFITSLFNVKVKSIDGKINTTFSDYINKYQKIPWWSYPQLWIKKLVKSFSSNIIDENAYKVNPFKLTQEQYNIAMSIQDLVKCSVDKKSDSAFISSSSVLGSNTEQKIDPKTLEANRDSGNGAESSAEGEVIKPVKSAKTGRKK